MLHFQLLQLSVTLSAAPRRAVPLAQPCPVAGWPRPVGTRALFKFVERGLASRSAATVNSVTPGVAMLCHQRVDDAWRALWPPNVTHARAANAAPALLAAARRLCRARLPSGVRQGLSPMPSKSKVDLVGNVRAKREQTYSLFQLSAPSRKESKRERDTSVLRRATAKCAFSNCYTKMSWKHLLACEL